MGVATASAAVVVLSLLEAALAAAAVEVPSLLVMVDAVYICSHHWVGCNIGTDCYNSWVGRKVRS